MASRRQFLKLSAFGLGSMTMGFSALKYARDFTGLSESAADMKVNLTRVPTYCEVCFWKCAGWVYKTRRRKIWKITGNDEDQHCNGRFCPRGTGGVGMYYDEDRLKKPLISTGKRGEFRSSVKHPGMKLLDHVAGKMKEIASEIGSGIHRHYWLMAPEEIFSERF